MKKLSVTTAILALLMPTSVFAELSIGVEAKQCFAANEDRYQQEDCLTKKREKSNKEINVLINETEKRIKANNDVPYNGKLDAKETSGEVYSRRFIEAQQKWQAYRDELCLAIASELPEDAYDYQSYIDQCTINLNKRHAEEINLMGLPPVR